MFNKIPQFPSKKRPRNWPIELKQDSEYIPAFALNSSTSVINYQLSYTRMAEPGPFNSLIYDELLGGEEGHATASPLAKIFASAIFNFGEGGYDSQRGIHSLEELEILCANNLPAVAQAFISNTLPFDVWLPDQTNNSYKSIFDTIDLLVVNSTRTRAFGLLSYFHSCFDVTYDESIVDKVDDLNPLFVLVIKPECLEYFRLCWLLGEEPLSEIFELWVNPEFDVPKSRWKYLRSQYRKLYKPLVVEKGIEIVEVPDIFDRLFNSIKQPEEIKSIKERKAWLEGVSESVIQHNRITNELSQRGIKLEL